MGSKPSAATESANPRAASEDECLDACAFRLICAPSVTGLTAYHKCGEYLNEQRSLASSEAVVHVADVHRVKSVPLVEVVDV